MTIHGTTYSPTLDGPRVSRHRFTTTDALRAILVLRREQPALYAHMVAAMRSERTARVAA